MTRLYEHPALHEAAGETMHTHSAATQLPEGTLHAELVDSLKIASPELSADDARFYVDVVLERFRALTDSPRTVDEIVRVQAGAV